MKKSEFEKKRRSFWQTETEPDMATLVNRDIWAAEAAGVVWDPEEEPLPERLFISYSGGGTHAVPVDGQRIWVFSAARGVADELRQRCFLEAVRRWNAWPLFRACIHRFLTQEDTGDALARSFLAILDDKEGG